MLIRAVWFNPLTTRAHFCVVDAEYFGMQLTHVDFCGESVKAEPIYSLW